MMCDGLIAGHDRPVVGPVDLVLYPGEVVGLLGSNGAGKSTLLNALTGQARIFGGRLTRASGLRMAHLRQQPVRLQECPLTGDDLVRLTGAGRRPPPVEVAPLLACRMDQLSGGQLQMIQVWACLGSEADVILLDEPTNNLDPGAMDGLTRLIREVREERTLLVVSHEPDFIASVCSRVVRVRQ